MDLKIRDVAELLNVSETTIRRWLADGKIPAYRLNHQYRFNRFEIEDWVMKHKLGKVSHATPFFQEPIKQSLELSQANLLPQSSGGSKQFSLYRAIHKGGVLYDMPAQSKEELIRASVKRIATEMHFEADVIGDLLLERERLQSTALNNGIAIPHTRDFLLNAHHDVVTVVFPKVPLAYDALDDKPVHTLFFLFASDDRHHLHLLAKIAHLSSQPETLELLKSKPSKESLLEFIKAWEGSIPQRKEED